MTIPDSNLAAQMTALRNEIDVCFDRLRVFPHQGMGLNMLSRIGQMAAKLQLEINNHIYHESNQYVDPRQLALDFDGSSASTDGGDAGQPEQGEVPRLA